MIAAGAKNICRHRETIDQYLVVPGSYLQSSFGAAGIYLKVKVKRRCMLARCRL